MEYLPVIYFLVVIVICSLLFNLVVDKGDKLSKWQKFACWFFIAVFTLTLYPVSALLGSITLSGRLKEVSFHGKDGSVLLAESEINQGIPPNDTTSFRMQEVDLRTNKILGRFSEFDTINYLGEVGNVMWFLDGDNGIHTRDAKDLKVLHVEDELANKNPHFSNGIADYGYLFDQKSGQMILTTKDGYNFAVDADSFDAKPIDQSKVDALKRQDGGGHDFEYNRDEVTLADHQKIRMSDETRNAIMKETGSGDQKFFPNSDLTFLKGQFFMDTFAMNEVVLDDPQSLVIISKKSLDDSIQSVLTRVSMKGDVVWERELLDPNGDDYIKAVHVLDDMLIVVTDYEIIALNAKDGKDKWRLKF